jgi:uncharacterized membrane protein
MSNDNRQAAAAAGSGSTPSRPGNSSRSKQTRTDPSARRPARAPARLRNPYGMSGSHDLPTEAPPRPAVPARTQVGVSIVAGAALAAAISLATSWDAFPILCWDGAALVYVAWVWFTIWRLDAEHTAELAVPEDPTRATADVLTLGAAVASLAAVGLVLGRAASSQGATQELLGALGVASVVLSWLVVHTVYTLRYARLYYAASPDGGIDFNDPEPPTYSDFAYLAFTIGMTFQVSDTDLQTNELRRTALRHGLLSFLFGTGIVATTINLIASLGGH